MNYASPTAKVWAMQLPVNEIQVHRSNVMSAILIHSGRSK